MKKRFLTLLLTIAAVVSCAFAFSACEEEHTHFYAQKITTEATCTEKGVITYTCSCNDTYTEEIPALGHNKVQHEAQVATCMEKGWEVYENCTRCDYTTYVEIPVLDHPISNKWSFNETHHWHEVACGCEIKADFEQHTLADLGYCTVCLKVILPTEGVLYKVSADGTHAEVIGCSETATEATIASTYNDLPVTRICDDAFSNCSSLTSIVFPDSLTSIDAAAFRNCGILTSLYIMDMAAWCNISFAGFNANPLALARNVYFNNEIVTELVIGDGVTSISDFAFSGYRSLTSVVIGDGVTSIGEYAFSNCDSLTSVVICDGVTSIGDGAFKNCDSLTSVVLPDSVTSIGGSAFFHCDSLTSVVIPDSVTSIGGSAFGDCSSLTSVVIGDSVTSIDSYAFSNCSSLTSITVSENNTAYQCIDGNLYTRDEKTLVQYAIGKTATAFTIPDSVTSIGDGAFSGCSSLTNVVIPDSVTSIGSYAFAYCSSLTSVEIPDGVTSIGNGAFSGCSSLTSVVIPDSVTSIGDGAFSDCRRLTSVVIPDSVTSIGRNAFMHCIKLTICCEAESKPSGWSSSWNSSKCPVVWGYQG